MRRNYQLLGLLLIFTLQCSDQTKEQREIHIQFEENLSIGSDSTEAQNHELFRNVTNVEVDQRGWMYVINAGEAAVRVYDNHGEYQFSFGNQGSGPGEFQMITNLHIDSQNRLLIVDTGLARISAYTLEGEFITSWEVPSIARVHQIKEHPSGKFVVVGSYSDQLVHIMDADFTKIESSFVKIEDLLTTNDSKERIIMQFYPGKVEILEDGSIVYVPALYRGELFNFSLDQQGNWVAKNSLMGQTEHETPASYTAFERAQRADLPIVFPGEGRYAAQFHSFSMGLFRDRDVLLHFSYQETVEGDLDLQVEYFNMDGSEDGDLIGTTLLEKMERIGIMIQHVDDSGNLYVADNREFPTLKRLAILH